MLDCTFYVFEINMLYDVSGYHRNSNINHSNNDMNLMMIIMMKFVKIMTIPAIMLTRKIHIILFLISFFCHFILLFTSLFFFSLFVHI